MEEAPPGTDYFDFENPGRGDDTEEGRTDLDRMDEEARDDHTRFELNWKRNDGYRFAGREESAFSHDAARWTEEEKAEALREDGDDF